MSIEALDAIGRLHALQQQGAVTTAEFEATKATLLQRVNTAPTHGAGAGFNVRDFGAIGDGKHDDTEAFEKALAAAAAVHHTISHGISVADVFVPAGEYLLGRSLVLDAHLHTPGIHGEGRSVAAAFAWSVISLTCW